MKKFVPYFFDHYNQSKATELFKKALYIFLLIKASYWLYYYQLYFGENAIALTQLRPLGSSKDFAFFLYNSSSKTIGYFFILALCIFLALSFYVRKVPFIFEFVIWILVVNIQNKLYPSLTGGDFLLNQFLFFNCLLAKNYAINSTWQNSLFICTHNVGVLAILIQIHLIYLVAGLSKLSSPNWINGSALFNLEQICHFNLFSNTVVFPNSLNFILTYIVFCYQLLFPIVLWFKKFKKPFLCIGIIIHLYIIFITGLVGFGITMLIAYIYLWPQKPRLANTSNEISNKLFQLKTTK